MPRPRSTRTRNIVPHLLLATLAAAACGCAERPPTDPIITGSLGVPTGYQLTPEERRLDCVGLAAVIGVGLQTSQELIGLERQRRSGAPPTVAAALERSFGTEPMTAATRRELSQQRERLSRLAVEAERRRCPAIDVETPLNRLEADIMSAAANAGAGPPAAADPPLAPPAGIPLAPEVTAANARL